MEPFIESGMTFGPYADGHCFRVELSKSYNTIKDGVQMAEFLLLQPHDRGTPFIWIVEAKASSPRPETQPSFKDFIGEIKEKLVNALTLGVAIVLKRHHYASVDIPKAFEDLNLSTVCFRLVLVINGHKKSWLQPLQDALRLALHTTTKTWGLGSNSVLVINHEDAKKAGLISAP
jgi:hypothetical protein